MVQRLRTWQYRIGLLTLVGASVFAAVLVWYTPTAHRSLGDQINSCQGNTSERVRDACFRSAIGAALEHEDGKPILKVLSAMPRGECHVPSHILGRELFRKYRTVEDAYAHCTEECSSGCTHGIIGAAFSEVPEIKASLDELEHPDKLVINTHGTSFCARSTEACHGIGHALFQLFGTFNEALDECSKLAPGKLHLIACERGVFMENSLQSPAEDTEGSDFKSFHDSSDLLYPCTSPDVASKYRSACFHFLGIEQDTTFRVTGISDAAQKKELRFGACGRLTDRSLYLACIEGAAYMTGAGAPCTALSADTMAHAICVGGVAKSLSAFDQYETVLEYCSHQASSLDKRGCYEAYFGSLFKRAVRPLKDACSKIADTECSSNLENFMADPLNVLFL